MYEEEQPTINLDELLENIRQIDAGIKEKTDKLRETRDALVAAEKLYQDLATQKYKAEQEINSDRINKRRLEKEKERLERFAAAEKRRNELLEDYNKKAAEIDELTRTAHWREWAYEHQIDGGKRLAIARRGILGDKRGLGKTLTSLIWLDMVQARKIIVFAKNDIVPQFEEEIRHWAAHRHIMSFAGLPPSQRQIIYPLLRELDSFIITINYEAWRRDKTIVDDLVAAGVDTIILDEAHKAKSSSKQTARGIFQIAFAPNYCSKCEATGLELPGEETVHWYQENYQGQLRQKDIDPLRIYYCGSCGQPLERTVKNVLSMTGTPILNKPQELFTMLHLVDPYRFQNEKQFLRDYCYSYAPGKWRFLHGGLERLTNRMSEFFIARNREDAGVHVPPPAITIHRIDPDPVAYAKQYQAYRDLTTAAAIVLERGEEKIAKNMLYILEIILRERQLITWPAGVVLKVPVDPLDPFGEQEEIRVDIHESQKLDAVEELLDELIEEGERVVIFSQFTAPLLELERRENAKGNKVTTATGLDSKFHRNQVRLDFDLKSADKENYQWSAVLATYKATSEGLNLNAARHVILIDDEWAPGYEDQAIGRIDRLNSEDQANVHIFRVNKTIDTFMEALLNEKKELAEGFETSISAKDMLKHLRGEKP